MACQGNMPGFKYVTVEGLVITYNGTPYPIKTFVTNKKYIVWNVDRRYQLEDTEVRPKSSLLEYLIVINDNGKPTIVEHDNLTYSFDQKTNGSNLASSGDYNALKNQVNDNTTKFNLISNTVDGMTQIIGSTEELEDGSIIYNLNKVKADSESYGISIGEIKTKVDDKYAEIKPIILNDLVEYLRSVSNYKLSFTDILEDTNITTEELELITVNKTNIINKITQLQTTLSNLKVIIDEANDVEKSQLIVDAKTQLTILHNSLISICDSYLLDNKISGEEKTNIIQKAYELTTYIDTVQNTCNNITVNGQAGVVYSIENELLILKDSTTSTIKELSKKDGELTEGYSEIKQTVDGITNTVSEIKRQIEDTDASINLTASTYVVAFDSSNNPKNNDDIKLTVSKIKLSGNVSWLVVPSSVTLRGEGDTRLLSPSQFENLDEVIITVQSGTLSKSIVIDKVKDGLHGSDGLNGADGVDGKDGVNLVYKGEYPSHPSNPQNGWYYRNTTERKTFVYQDNTWYQMTVDGQDGIDGNNGKDGLSVEYKGEFSSPPANPKKNWVYRDTDNGVIYIYTGTAWEVMTYDGNNGESGTNGTNGWSVFVTYNDSTTLPATPTGNGTTGGWHTNATTSVVWMSQKVASSSTSGTWGTPIKIKGDDGRDGTSVKILGSYNSEEELNQAHPSGNANGDGYIVNGDLYIWNGSSFINAGKIKGEDGTNGTSSYVHIKYSNDGKNFTSNNGETVGEWMGVLVDNVQQDSVVFSDYTWNKVKGQQGIQGLQGEAGSQGIPGRDGVTYYTWIKYANDKTGTGLSDDPTGKTYIGLAYNKTTATESTTPSDYMWSLIKGTDGVNGVSGADGVTHYTWIKYSDNANGNPCYDIPKSSTQYIGIAINKTTATESADYTQYIWSKFKGDTGVPGTNGTNAQYIIVTGEQIFKYTNNFTGTPTPASITLTASKFNTTSSGKWQYKNSSGVWTDWLVNSATVTATTLTVSPTSNMLSTNKQMTVRYLVDSIHDELTLVKVSDGTNGTDGTDGTNGKDAYTIVLSNESHSFVGSTTSALAGSTKCEIIAYKGTTRVAATIGTISGLPSGMTAPITSNGTTTAYFTPTVTTSMITKNGTLTIPITVDGKSFTKYFSYSLALKGVDGQTSYFHIKYSSIANPTTSSQISETPNTYIGTYVDYTATDSTDPTKYTWYRFQGLQGANGTNGIPGTNGTNGQTSYLHIKYSNDGGITFTGNSGEDVGIYIGQYTDFTLSDSNSVSKYKWSKIKGDDGLNGEDGASVDEVVIQYSKNKSTTVAPTSGWGTSMPTYEIGYYLWVRTRVKYSNNPNYVYSTPVCDQSWKASSEIYSEVIQLKDSITSRVSNVEALSLTSPNNLLINSNIKNSASGWRLTNLVERESLNRGITSAKIPDRNAIMIGNLNDLTAQTRYMDSTKFIVSEGESISISLHAMLTQYIDYAKVYILYTDNTSSIEDDNAFFEGYQWIDLDSTSWKKYTLTTTAPSGATRGFIRIRYVSLKKPTAADNNRVALASIMINRGEDYLTWTSNTEDNYSYQETRLKVAEQKITDDAITNTVKRNFYTKTETDDVVTSKGYQTSSQVQQTVDALQIKFQESGGYNLLYNGNFKRGIEMWSLTSGYSYIIGSGTWSSPDRCGIRLTGQSSSGGFLSQSMTDNNLINSYKYTLSGNVYISSSGTNDSTGSNFQLYCRVTYSDDTKEYFFTDINKTLYDKWQKVYVTFNRNTSKVVTQIVITMSISNTTKLFYASQIMLETGGTVSAWSHNPNEVYDGITTIDKDGITISMIDGEGLQGYSKMSYEGIATYDSNGVTKSWFGADDSAYIKELNVDTINNPYVIQCKPRSTSWYVGATETGDGTGKNTSNKSNSVQSILEYIRETSGVYLNNQNINIYCDSGVNLNENININGWLGSGMIKIYFGANSTFTGWMSVIDCMPYVILSGESTNFGTNDGCKWYREDGNTSNVALYVRNANVHCTGFRSHRGMGLTTYGDEFAYADYGARLHIDRIDLVKYSSIVGGNNSYTSLSVCRGDVEVVSDGVTRCTLIATDQMPIFNEGATINKYCCHVVTDWSLGNNSLWMPKKIITSDPEQPTAPSKSWHWVEKTFYFKLSSTTEGTGSTTSGWSDKWGQGKWGSYKSHRGHAKPTENISSWCNVSSNTRNISMTLTMTRLNTSHGYAGAVPTPKIKQKNGSYWDSGVAFARGDTKSISLSSGVISGLSDGTLSELTMWAEDSVSDYSQYNTVKLKVKCEKYY